jgi:hypothetical protein
MLYFNTLVGFFEICVLVGGCRDEANLARTLDECEPVWNKVPSGQEREAQVIESELIDLNPLTNENFCILIPRFKLEVQLPSTC